MFKHLTSAQKILEEFPCLWSVHQAWGPESNVRVETIQSRLSNGIDQSSTWWILGKHEEASVMEKVDLFHPMHNLAMVVVAHLNHTAPFFEVANLIEVKTVDEKKEVIVYKPPKGLHLSQLCWNRMAVMWPAD